MTEAGATTRRKRRGRLPLPTFRCMECGVQHECARDRPQHYCCKEHKHAYLNRNIRRGNKIFPLVYRWRALRSSNPDASNAAFSRLCSLLANWIEDDRARGRAVPLVPDSIGLASAVNYHPTTSQAEVERADREMNRSHQALKKRTGLK